MLLIKIYIYIYFTRIIIMALLKIKNVWSSTEIRIYFGNYCKNRMSYEIW